MEELNSSQPRQKIMTSLHRGYSNALNYLRQGKLPEGISQLQQILNHQFMSDTDMQNLKYSSLMSLANIYQQQSQPQNALAKYWQALQILSRRSLDTLQKGLFNLKQFNQERNHSQFTILLKMISLAEKLSLTEQSIYLYKKAISLSPVIWREKLLIKLNQLYQRLGKKEALQDLNYLLNNKKKLEQILTQNIIPQKIQSQHRQISQTSLAKESYLKNLLIKINIFQKQQLKLKYSCWQILLTITYILLKCKMARNFNKKYKKIEQSKEWVSLLKEYNPLRTNIQIELVQFDQNESNMEIQDNSKDSYSKVISDLATQILKSQYLKKKGKKQNNPLQQLTKNPSISSKDNKKQSITQTKSIYPSINQYYKDIFAKNGFKKQLLTCIKLLDENQFNLIFGKIYQSQIEPLQNKKQDQNDQDQQEKSNQLQPNHHNDKEVSKEKKSLKTRKQQNIAQNERLNTLLKHFFQKRSRFINIYQIVEEVSDWLITSKVNEKTEIKPLAFINIRKIVAKNITKVIQSGSGFFVQYVSPQQEYCKQRLQFLQLIIEKVEQLIEKDCKSKVFKDYQQQEKTQLIVYIKQHFTLSVYKTRYLLEQDSLQQQKLEYLSTLCLQFVRLNYLYGYVKPSEVTYYRNLYIAFRTKQEKAIDYRDSKRISEYIDRQIQQYQNKINSKSSLLTITQQAEESQNNIDQIFKKDHQLSLALPLLKVFNCFNSQTKSKSNEMVEQVSSRAYLQSFIKLCEIFFSKVECESAKQFNSRLLFLIADLMKVKQVIADLYQRFMHNSTFKVTQVSSDIFIQTLYHLLRFYLLNLYEENDHCIRIIFYVSNIVFRSIPDQVKYNIIPKYICTIDQLIKYKKFKPQLVSVIRKKFYQSLILKNLAYIYQSPAFRINQQETRRVKKKKGRKSSESEPVSQKMVEQIHQQHDQIKEKVYDILHDIYFSSQKEKEFHPKKIEQAVGYFMYLSRAFYQDFRCQVVQLQNQVCKIIKKCYKLYVEKRAEIFQYCDKFTSFKTLFEAVMNGDESPHLRNQFVGIIRRQHEICQCCSNLGQKYHFYIESLFVLGKYFQSQNIRDDLLVDKEQQLLDKDKDQNYYFQYLSLNLDSQVAWENIVRVNANKSYIYFDSLIGDTYEEYKGKFLYTKRVISFINENFKQYRQLVQYGNQKLQILNALKLKQREYNMVLKEIEVQQIHNKDNKELKQFKQLNKKYAEGLRKIWQLQFKSDSSDVKIRYLRVIEVKMKLCWLNIEKQIKQQKKEVIELDKDSDEQQISTFQPSKNVTQITQILADIQHIINGLPSQQKNDSVIHLQEDLVIEAYMFLYNTIDYKLQKMLTSLADAIRSTNDTQRNQSIKQAQYYLNDFRYTLAFFQEGLFPNNQKYKIKPQKLSVNSNQIQSCSNLFLNLFVNNKQRQLKRTKSASKNKKKQEESVIVISDQPIEEPPIQMNRKKSVSSVNSEKQAKNKQIIVDVGIYCSSRLKQQLKANENFKNLSKIKYILLSAYFLENIQKASNVFSDLTRIYMLLPKYQLKRYKNRRSVCMGLLQCSRITLKYVKQPQRALQLIKQHINIKSDQLVSINTHNDRLVTEKNQMLSEYYNRLIVHQIMKIKFIQHLFNIYEAHSNKQNFVIIIRRLLKLSRKAQKEISKADKEKEKQKTNKIVVLQMEEEKKQIAQIKEPTQNKNPKQTKQKQEKQQQIRCYYLLFCQGVSTFVNILERQSQTGPLDEKYEKNLIQFKNKMKKTINKDQNNCYFKKIDDFIQQYQAKFAKKIKMKKSKKQKQGQIRQDDLLLRALLSPQKPQQLEIQQRQQREEIIEVNNPFQIIIQTKKQVVPGQKRNRTPRKIIQLQRVHSNLNKQGEKKQKNEQKVIKKQKKIKKNLKQKASVLLKKDTEKISRNPRQSRRKKGQQPIAPEANQ